MHRHCQAKNSRRRKQSSYDIWVTSAVGHGFRWYVRGLLEILGFRQRLGNNIGVADGFGRKFCGAEVAVRMVRRAAEVGSSIFLGQTHNRRIGYVSWPARQKFRVAETLERIFWSIASF